MTIYCPVSADVCGAELCGEVTGVLYRRMCVVQKCVPVSEVTGVLYPQMCVEQKCVGR